MADDIKKEEFKALLDREINDYFLLDVREELEFHTFNIGGVNIPLGKIQKLIDEDELDIPDHKTIIVICQRGIRSKTAKTILLQNGYPNVRNLIGGLQKLQRP
ncbi:rhodanese-like domain-containing protein [Pseudoxanthomonas sp. SGD-10]|nr:rhodanese-like domain-containing protein [Pseudoxanthomonas sp. SGD-10]